MCFLCVHVYLCACIVYNFLLSVMGLDLLFYDSFFATYIYVFIANYGLFSHGEMRHTLKGGGGVMFDLDLERDKGGVIRKKGV